MESENGAAGQASLGALFERYAASLKRMLGTRSPQAGFKRVTADKDLDDLVQEAFLCALAFSRRTPTLLVTRAYLFTIARNLEIDRWRRRHNRVSLEPDGGAADAVSVCPDALAVEHEQREQAETLARYVKHLPTPLARVYETRFVQGLSQRDAAVVLGISRGQLRTIERRLLVGAIRELNDEARSESPAAHGSNHGTELAAE